jgi:hypothetical protein
VQGAGDGARAQRVVNRTRPDGGVAASQAAGVVDRKRAAGAETGTPGRSVSRGSAAEVPSASGEPRPAAMKAPDTSAAEMAASTEMASTAKMAAATEVTAAATMTTATMATASAASSGVDRARKRKRKNNHGQEFEFRHDNLLLKPPGLASMRCFQALCLLFVPCLSLGKRHDQVSSRQDA